MIEIIKISLICYVFYTIIRMEGSILNWYYRLIFHLPEWLYKPLGGCYFCFTGQVCLWYSIFSFHNTDLFVRIFDTTFYTAIGICLSWFYHKIFTWLDIP